MHPQRISDILEISMQMFCMYFACILYVLLMFYGCFGHYTVHLSFYTKKICWFIFYSLSKAGILRRSHDAIGPVSAYIFRCTHAVLSNLHLYLLTPLSPPSYSCSHSSSLTNISTTSHPLLVPERKSIQFIRAGN
jgi:hypothetical protein